MCAVEKKKRDRVKEEKALYRQRYTRASWSLKRAKVLNVQNKIAVVIESVKAQNKNRSVMGQWRRTA